MSHDKMVKIGGTDNGDEPDPLGSHFVELGNFTYSDDLGGQIEAMYQRLKTRADESQSLLLNVVQHISVIQVVDLPSHLLEPRVIVVITAQRISREELERQQRLSQFGQGPRR